MGLPWGVRPEVPIPAWEEKTPHSQLHHQVTQEMSSRAFSELLKGVLQMDRARGDNLRFLVFGHQVRAFLQFTELGVQTYNSIAAAVELFDGLLINGDEDHPVSNGSPR